MKKKILMAMIVVTLLLGGVQVYAATFLDSNIISLITDGVNSIKSFYTTTANTETEKLNKQYKEKIGQYVNDKTNQVIKDIETHKTSEINRANQELNTYFNNMKNETDTVVNGQVKQAKDSITTTVNAGIQNSKAEMLKELEKQIKEKLKK